MYVLCACLCVLQCVLCVHVMFLFVYVMHMREGKHVCKECLCVHSNMEVCCVMGLRYNIRKIIKY